MPHIILAYVREDRVEPYVEALAAAGVGPRETFRATPLRTEAIDLAALVRSADGLLLTGGADLQPCLYREARNPAAHLDPPVADRDQMEWDLLVHARAQAKPVFGICRGHQMLNVFLGGALYQDLALLANAPGHANFVEDGWPLEHPAHEAIVTASPHPFARELAAYAPIIVNSRHHQGVRRLGPGVEAIAEAPDGTNEATVLVDDAWWARSVQWHPENLLHMPVHRGLFTRFVAEAAQHHRPRPTAAPAFAETV